MATLRAVLERIHFGRDIKSPAASSVAWRGARSADRARIAAPFRAAPLVNRHLNALPATPFDRRDERTHLFLVATLDAGSASGAVRVRNLSPTGALVEAPQLPSVGTAVTLRRGSLEAAGTVVWAEAGRAGLSFAAPVFVGAWLPTGNASRQAKVDKMVHGLKQGERPAAIVPAIVPVVVPAVAPDPADASATLAMADLVRLRGELEHLGTTLARDAMVASAHPELQFFATAGQRLARIIAALRP